MDSKCARCGRALKDPASIERGIGPFAMKIEVRVFDADLNVDKRMAERNF